METRPAAQLMPLRKIGPSQGLSQSSVNAILRDSTGYMWFATQDGLNRYDGYTMTVYRHDPADTASLADNYLWRLAPARGGGFWSGTFKAGLSEDNVTAIHQDGGGLLPHQEHLQETPGPLEGRGDRQIAPGRDLSGAGGGRTAVGQFV